MISNDELIARTFMLNGIYGKLGKESKMKPFNLEAALRGEKVITRAGYPVVVAYNKNAIPACQVVGWIMVVGYCIVNTYYATGECISGEESPEDLFMAPPPKA